MRLSTVFAEVVLAASMATAALLPRQAAAATVYRFSGRSSPENIAVRASGQLLVTRMDAPEVWTIDPTTKAGSKLFTLPGVTSAAGITELTPDVFAVIGGKYSGSSGNTAGSWGIFKLDFTATTPTVSVLKMIPEGGMFNGLTTLNNDTLLIGDGKGIVYRLTASTGAYSVAIQDPSMAPPSGSPIPLGLDGLRYHTGFVYFTNIFKNTFSKVAVDSTGKATGSITPIWTNSIADDFTFGADGSAYVATNTKGTVLKVTPDGKISTAAMVGSSTACAFGRTEKDKNTLYVTSSAGSVAAVTISS